MADKPTTTTTPSIDSKLEKLLRADIEKVNDGAAKVSKVGRKVLAEQAVVYLEQGTVIAHMLSSVKAADFKFTPTGFHKALSSNEAKDRTIGGVTFPKVNMSQSIWSRCLSVAEHIDGPSDLTVTEPLPTKVADIKKANPITRFLALSTKESLRMEDFTKFLNTGEPAVTKAPKSEAEKKADADKKAKEAADKERDALVEQYAQYIQDNGGWKFLDLHGLPDADLQQMMLEIRLEMALREKTGKRPESARPQRRQRKTTAA